MNEMQSLVDQSKMVFPKQWVLSLVAKPQGRNPEHAIVIAEGFLEDGKKFVYRRYDFVMDGELDILIQKGKGLVLIKDDPKHFADYSEEERKRYFWVMIMKDANFQEGCRGASWIIAPEEAEFLHEKVNASRSDPPAYQILGEHSLIAKSTSQSGHNCFTWAKEMIKSITSNQNIQHDTRLVTTLAAFVGDRTTRALNPPEEETATTSPGCSMM